MKIKNRRLLTTLLIAGLGLFLGLYLISGNNENSSKDLFSFGVIADCQYCDIVGEGVRKYSLSENKLQECVNHLNTLNLEYVVHLGDFIDRDFKSFNVVSPIYDELKAPNYHVLGNHDFSVIDEKKKEVPKTLGMKSRYYDFNVKGWRFIVLDGNDISFHAYPSNSEKFKEVEEYYKVNNISSPKWNGAIGIEQISWLRKILDTASRENEKVILFCHFPVFPPNKHNLWNSEEIIKLIESYSCVKAYINGHNHQGEYGIKDGIHYLTLKGMVDTYETSYATVNIYGDSLKIIGYGREEDKNLVLR